MGRYFVSTESVRLDLPKCGTWIQIKKELNRSEYDTVIGAGVSSFRKTAGEDTDFNIDAGKMNIVKLQTWLIDWGLTDTVKARREDGSVGEVEKPVAITASSIQNLRVDVSTEILEVIEAHQARLEEEKKAQSGVMLAEATSR